MEMNKWTGSEIRSEYTECKSLAELIALLEKRFEADGKVICQIKVNDMIFSEDDEARLGQADLNDIESIEVGTSSLDQLYEDSLKSVCSMIPQMKHGALQVAEDLRHAHAPGTQRQFAELIDTCHWLTEALRHLQYYLLEHSQSPLTAQIWNQVESKYAKVVAEMLAAYEAKDWVRVSDAIEYDLTSLLDKWLEILET